MDRLPLPAPFRHADLFLCAVLLTVPCCACAQAMADNVPPATPVRANAPQAPAELNSSGQAVSSTASKDPALTMPPSELLADTLSARGRYLVAIRTYEALPQTPTILNKLGIACEHMMLFDKARASFQAALKLDPKYAEAYNNLGTLAHTQGDVHTAEKMYKKSLKLKPNAANTLQNLGTLYYAEAKFKKGDVEYRKALAIDPHALEHAGLRSISANTQAKSVSEVHYHMAATYASSGSLQLALQYLRQAVAEGFHDRNRLLHDKDFGDLRTSEAFLQVVDDLKRN